MAVSISNLCKADARAKGSVLVINSIEIRPDYLSGKPYSLVIRSAHGRGKNFIQAERLLAADEYTITTDISCFPFYHAPIGKYSNGPSDSDSVMFAFFVFTSQI